MLSDDILRGERRALARLLTLVENDPVAAAPDLAALFAHTGRAHIVGVTGAPGTGKSSLVNQMALHLRREDRTVAIIAVDPTSPFSGGAILGDRIRMRDLSGDSGAFIRSMATRGSLGGVARATSDVVKVLDAAGFDTILIETVGAGQSEVDIARHAQTVIVVEAPGLGDDVQAIKAGILEIADVLVVNKADEPRAASAVKALKAMLDLSHPTDDHRVMHHGRLTDVIFPPQSNSTPAPGWHVPVLTTNALTGEGIPAVLAAMDRHRAYLRTSGEMQRRERARVVAELDSRLRDVLVERLLATAPDADLAALVDAIATREIVPQAAIEQLVADHWPE